MDAPQTLLVLCGLPGSGKTTLASLFVEAGWVHINQDQLGDRKQCEAACSAALAAGRCVVVDRCNHSMQQRAHFLDLARRQAQRGRGPVQLLALCLELPVGLCVERAVGRGAHATLAPTDAPDVIRRFASEWQAPQRREGFGAVLVARTSEQATALAAQVLAGQALPLPPPAAALAVEPAVPQQHWMQAPPGHVGQQQQPWQQQPGWQVQQRQHFGSRADAASSWRRPANGEAADAAPPAHERQQPPRSPRRAVGGNNAVPFRPQRQQQHQQRHEPHHPRRHPWHGPHHRHDALHGPPMDLVDGVPACKPILLFDANGTLTSHTSMRRSAGVHRARPGVEHLRRLSDHFILGLFSSATAKTIDVALRLLEEAAGPGAPLFDRRFVLHRSHTFLAPHAHVAAGGKEWDTVKPLRPYFARLHRVLLVDDDRRGAQWLGGFKSCAGEKENLILMPLWDKDDPADRMIPHLVDTLLQLAASLGGDPEADMRPHTAAASQRLAALAAEEQAQRAAAQAPEPEAAVEGQAPAAAVEAAAPV